MAKKRQQVPQSAEGKTVMVKIEKLKIAKGNRLLVVTVTVKRPKKAKYSSTPTIHFNGQLNPFFKRIRIQKPIGDEIIPIRPRSLANQCCKKLTNTILSLLSL